MSAAISATPDPMEAALEALAVEAAALETLSIRTARTIARLRADAAWQARQATRLGAELEAEDDT